MLEQKHLSLLKEINDLERQHEEKNTWKLNSLKEEIQNIEMARVKADKKNQMDLFMEAKEWYLWQKEKMNNEQPLINHTKEENERKGKVLAHIKDGLTSHLKHINNVQKNVLGI